MFKWSKMAGPGTIWYMMFVMFACDAPFYLTIAVDCCCVFLSFIKKRNANHTGNRQIITKKKTLNRNTQPSLKKQLEAYIHAYADAQACSMYIVLRLGVEPVIIVIPSQISLWTVLLSILCCFLHIIFSIPLEHLFKSTNEPIKRLMRGRATEMRERATESKKKDIKCDF